MQYKKGCARLLSPFMLFSFFFIFFLAALGEPAALLAL